MREQRYWEDVEEGEEIKGFSLDITPRRGYLQVSGSQDWYPAHFDPAFARKAGHEDIFMNTHTHNTHRTINLDKEVDCFSFFFFWGGRVSLMKRLISQLIQNQVIYYYQN